MSPAEKAEHIFTYHKWTILLVLVALIVLGSIIHRQLTQKKPVLYLAVINVSFGEDVQKSLTEDFVTGAGFDERRPTAICICRRTLTLSTTNTPMLQR